MVEHKNIHDTKEQAAARVFLALATINEETMSAHEKDEEHGNAECNGE